MNALWLIARASGIVAAVLLTAVVALGVMRSERWQRPWWPRFASNHLHRSLSWLLLVVVVLHVGAVILDQYAPVAVWDAVVPFVSAYRRWWTGLGTLAFDVVLLVLFTTSVIRLMGQRRWRLLHWISYAAWPLAVLHGAGTGSDVRQWWALLLLFAAAALAAASSIWRLSGRSVGGGNLELGGRALGAAAVVCGTCALVVFTVSGPLQPGWAQASGTSSGPAAARAIPLAAHAGLPSGLADPLAGPPAQQTIEGTTLRLSDQRDTSLSVIVAVVVADPSVATVTVDRANATACSTPVAVRDVLTGICGGVAISVTLNFDAAGDVVGELTTTPV